MMFHTDAGPNQCGKMSIKPQKSWTEVDLIVHSTVAALNELNKNRSKLSSQHIQFTETKTNGHAVLP